MLKLGEMNVICKVYMDCLTNEGQGTIWHSLLKHTYKERLLSTEICSQCNHTKPVILAVKTTVLIKVSR